MRILQLTNYSAGGCGVFARVIEESKLLKKKGHTIEIFSSNKTKGSKIIAEKNNEINGIKILRFPAFKLGGESFMYWFGRRAEIKAMEFNPDVIIAHSYRQLHTIKALKFNKVIGCKVFLVTHAPFNRSTSRDYFSRFAVFFFDYFIGKNYLNKFDKVISITKWENEFLHKFDLSKDKLEYIPNGIREEFFKNQTGLRKINTLLYCGRISKIKQIETLLNSLPLVKRKSVNLQILGPAEKNYLVYLNKLIKINKSIDKVKLENRTYSITEQIKSLDTSKIFVLPSKSEGLPQVLLEAMARKTIVLASDNMGSKEVIDDGKNGFLFKNGDFIDLSNKIDKILSMEKKEIERVKKEAKKSVNKFKWTNIIKKLEKLLME